MMIEVRDYESKEKWEPIDFYTSALADVPLSIKSSNTTYTVRKKFQSLFNHNSTLKIQSKVNKKKNSYTGYEEIFAIFQQK